jgi:hypothetical protein
MLTLNKIFILANTVLMMLIALTSTQLYSQVPGCKDAAANNYNSSATVNDGSCTYNITNYTPPVKTDPLDEILIESGGLQMAGNFLWSFNDGGGAAAIYRIDTLSGNILQTVNLGGAVNVDWEDITFDGDNFYIGDFGNNVTGARTDLKIYKFPLSAIDFADPDPVTIPSNQIEIINFTYSDQLQPPADTTVNSTKFDCEAMIVNDNKIHLFTKNWVDYTSTHYIINNVVAGNYTAIPVDTLDTGFLVTAADKAPGKDIIVLLGYQNTGFRNHFMHILSDYSGGYYFNGNKRRIDLPDATGMGQAEGIAFNNDSYGYISNERLSTVLFTVTQKLRSFNLGDFLPFYVLPLALKSFAVNTVDGSHKIAWSFNELVQNLQVEYSIDGINFKALKTYKNSATGIFLNKTLSGVNYYRIRWQHNNGPLQYSNIISIKNEWQPINKISLKQNGELSFLLNGNSAGKYSFKILSSDGKLLSQLNERVYTPGLNNVFISKKNIANNFVYLMVYSNKHEATTFLQVQK